MQLDQPKSKPKKSQHGAEERNSEVKEEIQQCFFFWKRGIFPKSRRLRRALASSFIIANKNVYRKLL